MISKDKISRHWDDNDLADFKQKVISLSTEIKRLEVLKAQGQGIKISLDGELKKLINIVNNFSADKRLAFLASIKV